MRLTLRTLLAYLDDILEPAEARDMGAKVAESSMAQSLVNRIRDVMRRRRLLAPDVEGPGMGVDPNVVAEYLDNTLPPGDVADVERVCLESDIHLAEVAACHQILTLVLGEPVEVVPRSRERMYALGPIARKPSPGADGRPAGSGVAVNGQTLVAVPISADGSVTATEPSESRIPEYLRSKPFWQRALPWCVVIALAVVFVWLVTTDPDFRLGQRDSGANAAAAPGELVPAAPIDASKPAGDAARPLPVEATVAATAAPSGPAAAEAVPFGESGAGAEKAVAAPPPPPNPPRENVAEAEGGAAVKLPPPPSPAKPGAGKPDAGKPAIAKSDATKPDAGKPAAPPVTVPPGPKESVAIEYTSKEGVLLYYGFGDLSLPAAAVDKLKKERRERGIDPDKKDWYVLPRLAFLHAGEGLAAPEPFDANLAIDKGRATVTVLGNTGLYGTMLGILGTSDAFPFGFEVRQGRIVVQTRSNENAEQPSELTFGLVVGNDAWRVDLRGNGAVCAIEIVPREPEGFQQDLGPNFWTGRLYLAVGEAVVTEPSGRRVALAAKTAITLAPAKPEAPDKAEAAESAAFPAEPPRWIDPNAVRPGLRRYAVMFEKEFDPKDAVSVTMPALINHPTYQLSEFAVKTLALTQNYPALVKTLATCPHKESRLAAIAGLRTWLAAYPKDGPLLLNELGKSFDGGEDATVYELLWGVTPDDARDSTKSTQLVDRLDSEQLAIRELAFYHLHKITGLKYDYDAQMAPTQRQLSVNRWRTYLEKEGGALLKK